MKNTTAAKSLLFKGQFCLLIETNGNKSRIATYENYRKSGNSIHANNLGKKVLAAKWVNSLELEETREILETKKQTKIKELSIKLAS